MAIYSGSSGKMNKLKGTCRAMSMTTLERDTYANKVFPSNIFIRADNGVVFLTDGITTLGDLEPLHLPASVDDGGNVITSTYATKTELSNQETSLKEWCYDIISTLAIARFKPRSITRTISVGAWVDKTVVVDIGVGEDYTINLTLPNEASTDNMMNVAIAGVYVVSHIGTAITLKCLNSEPTEDIRLVFSVFDPEYDAIVNGNVRFTNDIAIEEITTDELSELWNNE